MGIWIQVDENVVDYLEIVGNVNDNPGLKVGIYILTGVGAFIFLVGFLGCTGACCETSWMLLVVSIFANKYIYITVNYITVHV